MLYGTNIYKAYLKVMNHKKNNPKTSEFSNVTFKISDIPGGYCCLEAFIRNRGLTEFTYYPFERFPMGRNSYIIEGDHVEIRCCDMDILRRMLFKLHKFTAEDGLEMEEELYIYDIETNL